jgi:hypothetical protein
MDPRKPQRIKIICRDEAEHRLVVVVVLRSALVSEHQRGAHAFCSSIRYAPFSHPGSIRNQRWSLREPSRVRHISDFP